MSQSGNARDAILDAAEDVVRESGAAHLTLDKVSARAGVSKGGLLYHFKSKEALLEGMLDRLKRDFAARREAEAAKLPATQARQLKAHILSAVSFGEHELKGVATALLAAGAHAPKLLQPARDARDLLVAEMKLSGLPAAFTSVILLTLDGLLTMENLGMYKPTPQERQAITRELLRLVEHEETRVSSNACKDTSKPRPTTRTKAKS